MNSGFSDNFMRGAQLVLQAHGIKDQKEQQQWMQKLWQSRLETEGLERKQTESGIEREKQFETEMSSAMTPPGYETPGQTMGMEWDVQQAMPVLRKYYPNEYLKYATQMMKPRGETGWKPGSFEEAIAYEKAKVGLKPEKPEKPTNMPPWYDALGTEIMGSEYHTGEGQRKFADWYSKQMATPKGREQIMDFQRNLAANTATPLYLSQQTGRGLLPLNARTGQYGEPSGYDKPLTGEMVTQEQQIGSLLNILSRAKKDYKPEYVGTITGRLGKVGAKYIGVGEQAARFYSNVSLMRQMVIYLYSGKQINENEYARLLEALPVETMPESTFNARLENFESVVGDIIHGRKNVMGGYTVPERGVQPKQTQDKFGFSIGDRKRATDGKWYTYMGNDQWQMEE